MSEITPPNGGGGSTPLRHGARDVQDAQENLAAPALTTFLQDLGLDGVTYERRPEDDAGGRYAFTLTRGDESCVVAVPGLPIERLRRVDQEAKIWDFVRLFVDDRAWVWDYALRQVRKALD